MAPISREALIAPKTKTVHLESGEIVIRALRASEALELSGKELQSADVFGLLAASILEPKLTTDEVGQIPISVLNKIVAEVFSFNALGEKAIVDAQAELKKAQAEG